jgi:DNA polymerase III delta subunit
LNSFSPGTDSRQNPLASGYFFYGEETYPAYQFIAELKVRLSPAGAEDLDITKCFLETDSWNDIIDSAKTLSLFTPTSRLVVVESPLRKKENIPTRQETLSALDKTLLEEYFSEPSPGTVLVVIFPGKIKRSSPLIKFFNSLPKSTVQLQELTPLRDFQLARWVEKRLVAQGKSATPDAISRLVELTGNDLRRIQAELDKIVTFIGEKNRIERDDIDEISGWIRSFIEWELSDHLERADYKKCLIVVNRLLYNEGTPPVRIVDLISCLFRDVLLVKLRLKAGKRDKRAIFKEVKPQIQEKYRRLYQNQFYRLFSLAEALSWDDLNHIVAELQALDVKLKTTGLPFQAMLEGFIFEYCALRKKRGRNYGRGQ